MTTTVLNPQLIAAPSRTLFDQARSVGRSGDDHQALKNVAQDFEALMMEQMMKSMRKANEVFAEDGLFASDNTQMWQEWQDTQLSIDMARTRSLGLAEQIIAQVEKQQGR